MEVGRGPARVGSGQRFLPVLPADVDRVSEIRKTVTLQRDPREFVAARLVDGR